MLDRATHMGFASVENYCFNSKPPKSPKPFHQEGFCLGGGYAQCILYHAGEASSMPAEIGAAPPVDARRLKSLVFLFALVIVAGAALLISRGRKDSFGDLPSVWGSAAQASVTPMLGASSGTATGIPASGTDASAPESGPLPTDTPMLALSIVETSTPLATNAVTASPSLHGFEIVKLPPGTTQGYLVHMVAAGETLDVIAAHYDTTVQAIIAVNYKLKPPVWVHYPIVIPKGATDATGLPAFDVYVVDEAETITAESLAENLGVDASALEFYNLCTRNCQFNKGDVLLVPYTD